MAKVQTSALISGITGSLSGTTFRKGRSGTQMKSITTPRRPRTARQQEIRGKVSEFAGKWNSLTQIQRDMWNRFAGQYMPGATGFNAFIGLNTNLFKADHASLVYTSEPPLTPGTPEVAINLTILSLNATTNIIQWENPQNTSDYISVYYAVQVGFRQNGKESWHFVGTVRSDTGYITHTHAYPAGYRIVYKAFGIDTRGRTSPDSVILSSADTQPGWNYPTFGLSFALKDTYADAGSGNSSIYLGSGVFISSWVSSGTLRKSTDSGLTWTNAMSVGEFETAHAFCKFSNGNSLVCTEGDGKVILSTDNFETGVEKYNWSGDYSSFACDSDGGEVAIFSKNPSAGLWRSDDSGASFSQIAGATSSLNFISIKYLGSNNWLAFETDSDYVYTSSDNGLTWTQRTRIGLSRNISSIDTTYDGIVIVGCTTGGVVYKSTNYGLTWNIVYDHSSLTDVASMVYIGFGVFLGGFSSGTDLIISYDYGSTWSILSNLCEGNSFSSFSTDNQGRVLVLTKSEKTYLSVNP